MARARRSRCKREPEDVTNVNEPGLAQRTFELPEMFADRLPESTLRALRSMARGGEWGELLDLLVAALQQTVSALTVDERNKIQQVLEGWRLPTDQLDELVVRQ
jgi:hypothetical protein